MTYFDKMVKEMRNKDLDTIQDWLHPDFLFVADFEMLTREDWLEETKKEFNRNEVTFDDNAICTSENEHIIFFEQKYVREGQLVLSVNSTHFRDGKPFGTIINRTPFEE